MDGDGRELQMRGAENEELLQPILVVLMHSTLRSPWLAEFSLAGPDPIWY